MSNAVPEWFAVALEKLGAGDMPGWTEMYEEDAVHEFPFAPDWMPKRLKGKSVILAYMVTVPSTVTLEKWTIEGVREAGDELIINGYVDGKRTAGGTPFHMEIVWIITHEGGRVSRFLDYMNPLRFTDADAEAAEKAASSH